MQSKQYSLEVGGKTMTAEFTDLAEQANGSVILRYGNTAVLATAVMSSRTRDDIDYFPLTVDFEERFYAAGQILGSQYVRREGRPSEQAILNGRVVDRTIRPLFPQHIRNEVQVIITMLALDEEDPAPLAVNAASIALAVSDIPWGGPVAAVRIGKAGNSDFVINPTYKQREDASTTLDVLACGKDSTINMIEVGAKQVDEDTVAAAFAKAVVEHDKIIAWQKQMVSEIGKEKRSAQKPEIPAALQDLYDREFASKIKSVVFCGKASKDSIHEMQDAWKEALKAEEFKDVNPGLAKRFLEDKVDEEIHRGAIEDGARADGRAMNELRNLYAKAGGVSPILHGSTARAFFTAAVRTSLPRLPWAAPATRKQSTRWKSTMQKSALCTITTSRRTRQARPAAWAG
jgi:polyribonucleotide nucleotidyltransferase